MAANKKLRIDISKDIKKLELITKKVVTGGISGQYRSAFRGRGLEFDGYRNYTQDDDASLIDWKASLKSNKLLIQEKVEERNLEILFLVDVSEKMIFGSTEKLKLEYIAEFVVSLTYKMLEEQDSVGLALFNDKIIFQLKPSINKNQFYRMATALTNPSYYGGNFDIVPAIKFTLNFLNKNAILFIVSDFLRLQGEWQDYLKVASKKFDLITVVVNDPRDLKMPEDSYKVMVADPFSNKQLLIDPKLIKEEYEFYVKQQQEQLRDFFIKQNIDYVELSTEKPFVDPIIELFQHRKRKWR